MYKTLIFDLDGTVVPNRADGMPSDNLVKVIRKLQNSIKVCAATGRPLFNSKPIIQKLGLTDPCIISAGTQIIDPVTEKILWEKDMDQSQIEKIIEIALPYPYQIFFSDEETSAQAKDKIISGPERVVYIEPVDKEDTKIILQKLTEIANITAHYAISWTPNCFDIQVTHSEATKGHALEILLKMLNVQKEELVAAGDSNNDMPLFELAAYKIAMENGTDELKKEADLIAPNVNDDGLAKVLEEMFILNLKSLL